LAVDARAHRRPIYQQRGIAFGKTASHAAVEQHLSRLTAAHAAVRDPQA